MTGNEDNWKTNGVRIIPGDSLDKNTPQTPGMTRAAAINYARVGAQNLGRDGQNRTECQNRTAPSRIARERYLRGTRARPHALGRTFGIHRGGWAGRLHLHSALRAASGNKCFAQEPLKCVVVRSDQETVVVNLDIEPVEKPEAVAWIDPIHRRA